MVKIPVKTAKEQEQEIEQESEEQQKQEKNEHPSSEDVVEESAVTSPEEEAAQEEPAVSDVLEESGESEATEMEPSTEDMEQKADEADEALDVVQELQRKEQEAKDHYDARLRLQAEFDNFKKRKEKEIADFRKYANESLLVDILPVVYDFERAIAAAEQTHKLEDFLQGVEMIFSKFVDVLKKKGVQEIEATPGQPFNPEIHEAVTQIETDEVEEDAIAQVFQKGYYLHDRILRAPIVGVAKPKG